MGTTELERAQRAIGAAMAYLRGMDAPGAVKTLQYINDILNPPPTYKEVTVERWECDECGKVYDSHNEGSFCGAGSEGCECESTNFTKLTGTRHVPVKQPARQRVSGNVIWMENRTVGVFPSNSGRTEPFIKWSELAGKTGTLTFEWEE